MESARGNLTRKRLNSYIYKPLLPLLVEENIDYDVLMYYIKSRLYSVIINMFSA